MNSIEIEEERKTQFKINRKLGMAIKQGQVRLGMTRPHHIPFYDRFQMDGEEFCSSKSGGLEIDNVEMEKNGGQR